MKNLLRTRLTWSVVLLATAALLVGCESSSPSMDGATDYFDENPVVIDPAAVNPEAPMRLMPGSVTLEADGDAVRLHVDGGRAPYSWAVNDVSKGSVIETGSRSAIYQRSDTGDNVVICSDSRGQTVLAAISQP